MGAVVLGPHRHLYHNYVQDDDGRLFPGNEDSDGCLDLQTWAVISSVLVATVEKVKRAISGDIDIEDLQAVEQGIGETHESAVDLGVSAYQVDLDNGVLYQNEKYFLSLATSR